MIMFLCQIALLFYGDFIKVYLFMNTIVYSLVYKQIFFVLYLGSLYEPLPSHIRNNPARLDLQVILITFSNYFVLYM